MVSHSCHPREVLLFGSFCPPPLALPRFRIHFLAGCDAPLPSHPSLSLCPEAFPKLQVHKITLTLRKRGGVQKSMANKVPWKTGMLIYLPGTSRPLISLQKEAISSPCNFATAHWTACTLNFLCPFNFATHETEDPLATPQQ